MAATATVTGASPPIPFFPPLPPPDDAAGLAPELEQPFRISSAVTAAVRIQKLWNRFWPSHTPKAIGCIGRIRDFGANPMVKVTIRTLQGLGRVQAPKKVLNPGLGRRQFPRHYRIREGFPVVAAVAKRLVG